MKNDTQNRDALKLEIDIFGTVHGLLGKWGDIEEIYIPHGVKRIEQDAFNGGNIKVIHIPETTEIPGDMGIEGFDETHIYFSEGSKYYCYDDNFIINKEGKSLVTVIYRRRDNPIIPNFVTKIGDLAFKGSYLKKINIPEGISEIGQGSFSMCSLLESISLPKSLKIIGKNAFASTSFKELYIPENVTKIGYGAFMLCRKLQEIRIPERTEIEDDVFRLCNSNLKIIRY